MKISLIDVIGLTYDGTTLEKYGLGGSESAVIYMAKELAAIGFDVTVFNNCIDSRAKEGVYDNVKYVDLSRLHAPNDFTCDVMIASRSVTPFLPQQYWAEANYPVHIFEGLRRSAKHKVLWLHDTFIQGDNIVEELVVNGHIDELFTLSDFHTTYITNCQHGRRRNFEVLKNKVFMTRNGAKRWIEEVDINKKDKDLFIYNASLTKGMIPLVNQIWPQVKRIIPTAKLKVIGGYYRFRDNATPDAQEVEWRKLIARPDLNALDIEFTGIIPQAEIAQHLAKASFMIFPGAFPETFGISSLESLLYNTPLITTRFGALEETAVDLACYKIDYAIEPNVLFTDINSEQQVQKFVQAVVQAYYTPYLHIQKMQYCDIVKDIAGWDGVALQWKQHLYKKLGLYFPVDEFREVSKLNKRLHQVYGRRFSNSEEWEYHQSYPQQNIVAISPFYNGSYYIERCIRSVATQDYENYVHVLIDDCSTDNGYEIAKETILSLPEKLRSKFLLIKNSENMGAVKNHVDMIRSINDENAIIMLLDGDDALVNNNTIFHMYNTLYDNTTEFAYGSSWSEVDTIPLVSQPYPQRVKETKEYRKHLFPWGMPYTHLRTFRKYLINNLPDSVFQTPDGEWFKAGGDNATFYNLLEAANPEKVKVVTDIIYLYNDKNPINDYKVNLNEQSNTAHYIRNQSPASHTDE